MSTTPEPRAQLQAAVDALDWWHQIDLGAGIVTPGADRTAAKLATLALPASFAGRSVLDIGAYDGFFSFEAERRGASRVVALDCLAWQRGPTSGRACFELARRALGSKVEDVYCDVMDLSPVAIGRFDVVLLLGVLYHLRDPLLALERVAAVTNDTLILETHTDRLDVRTPSMRFYPGDELNADASNWWGPNEAAVIAMLREVGFESVRCAYRRPLHGRLARALRARIRPRRVPIRESLHQGRLVVHARKSAGSSPDAGEIRTP